MHSALWSGFARLLALHAMRTLKPDDQRKKRPARGRLAFIPAAVAIYAKRPAPAARCHYPRR